MPLRDHFRPPLNEVHWTGIHSSWANEVVRRLNPYLPKSYRAVPHAHLGTMRVEAHISAYRFDSESGDAAESGDSGGGVATAVWTAAEPTVALDFEPTDMDAYEVLVYETTGGARLVGVVEFVSPRNKDRPDARRAFVGKRFGYLVQGVSLVVVDAVTERMADMHAEFCEVARIDTTESIQSGGIHAAAYRTTSPKTSKMEIWYEPLTVGEAMPTMPLWIAGDLAVPVELEASYNDTCEILRVPRSP